MAKNGRVVQAESFIFILFSILLAIFTTEANAAPPPAVPLILATTSSSTSPSGLPVPPSKTPAAPVAQDTLAAKNMATNQQDSRVASDLQNQAFSSGSSLNDAQGTMPGTMNAATDNQFAHHQPGESFSALSLNSEANNGIGETSKVINGEKAAPFVEFPPFSKQLSPETRYQRQRRSYPITSLAQPDSTSGNSLFHFTRPDELELRLDDDKDREAFLKLMSIIANSNNNRPSLNGISNNGFMLNDDLSSMLSNSNNDDTPLDDTDDADDEDAADWGHFQRPVANPYWTPSLAVGTPSEPLNLMSSLLAAEPPRTSSSSHGLYGLGGERPALPLEVGIARRALALTDEDGNDGEWMEQALPLHGSHFKTRRSGPGGNNEFTFNPVKSHFRRYLRAVPLKSGRGLEFMASGGQFGSIVPPGARFNRRRRAVHPMVTNKIPAVHWM